MSLVPLRNKLRSLLLVPNGKRSTQKNIIICREHATSTMALVSSAKPTRVPIFSTLYHVEEKDYFSTLHNRNNIYKAHQHDHDNDDHKNDHDDPHMTALFKAAGTLKKNNNNNNNTQQKHQPLAVEMDLVQASTRKYHYDKILLLVHHGEPDLASDTTTTATTTTASKPLQNEQDKSQKLKQQQQRHDPPLSSRGAGEVMNLSRRVATFCNDDTGLLPELVVMAPSKCVIQTSMMAFAHYSPESIRSIPWLCHPLLLDHSQQYYYYDTNENNDNLTMLLLQSKRELIQQTNEFIQWLQKRDEHVIVVSSQSSWFQAMCAVALDCEHDTLERFHGGEMRVLGLKF